MKSKWLLKIFMNGIHKRKQQFKEGNFGIPEERKHPT